MERAEDTVVSTSGKPQREDRYCQEVSVLLRRQVRGWTDLRLQEWEAEGS